MRPKTLISAEAKKLLYQEMSELFDIQVIVQKEKNFWGSRKLPQAHEKVCDKNERNKQRRKNDVVVNGKKLFIRHIRRTRENDLNKL